MYVQSAQYKVSCVKDYFFVQAKSIILVTYNKTFQRQFIKTQIFQHHQINLMNQSQQAQQRSNLIRAIIELSLQNIQLSAKQSNLEEPQSNLMPKQQSLSHQNGYDVQYYCNKALEELGQQKGNKWSKSFDQKDFEKFKQFYHNYQNECIKVIEKENLLEECSKLKNSVQQFNEILLIQQLKIVDFALYYQTDSQHRLRIPQIMTIYFSIIKKDKDRRILFQILTGEGKSSTIACLAAILYMQGHTVDIITTSKMLAKRDAQKKKDFYGLMGIEVTHNLPSQSETQQQFSSKECYSEGKIVYGTPFSFQVDLLLTQYKRKGIRFDRPYNVAIIDQVDSMFIDSSSYQTLLSTTYTGFSELILPMRIIWQTVIMHNIVKQGSKLYFYKQTEKQQIIRGQVNEAIKVIIKELRQKFRNEVIPEDKMAFVELSKQGWVWSAIEAAHLYKEDQHYVVRNGEIIPVDWRGTGSFQKNVEWEKGLQQFLQMKHGLRVSVENMTSNYISNIGHFNRYDYVFGMTGTLGSLESKKFLNQTYNASMLSIPSFLPCIMINRTGSFQYSLKHWTQKILNRCKSIIQSNRSILIICQTIHYAKVIHQKIIQQKMPHNDIKLIISGQENNFTESKKVDQRQIIVATNVAGRGMDLRITQKLKEKGGLHVCITFMPQNKRVEMQARGRAGRNGMPGSSQLIVNHTEYFTQNGIKLIDKNTFVSKNYQGMLSYICKQVRDPLQAQQFKSSLQKISLIKLKDSYFQQFSSIVNDIEDYHTNKAKRDAIQEQWALFIKKSQHLKYTNKQFQAEAKKILTKIKEDSQQFYKIGHNVWRGLNQVEKGNLQKSREYFIQLQQSKRSSMQKVTGLIYEVSVNVNLKEEDRKSLIKNKKQFNSEDFISSQSSKLSKAIELLEQRKQFLKATHTLSLCTNNKSIVNIMDDQKQKQSKKLRQMMQKSVTTMGSSISLSGSFGQKIQFQSDQKQQLQELLNNEEIKVHEAIQQHIKTHLEVIRNVKPGQSIEIKLQPLAQLIDLGQEIDMDVNRNNKNAIDKVSIDLPYLPVAKVTRIKVEFWKRAFVFAIGVLQVCVGALIITYSVGYATPFGAYMVQCGIRDCMMQFFTPQICADLEKFFSKKSIQYALSLVMIGTEGMTQLAMIGKNSFSVIENCSMQQVMKEALEGIKTGIIKGGFDWKSIAKSYFFKGLSQKIGVKKMISGEVKENVVVSQEFEVMEMVKLGFQQEKNIEILVSQLKKKVTRQIEVVIKDLVNQACEVVERQLSFFRPNHEVIKRLVNQSFEQVFQLFLNDQKRKLTSAQIMKFLKEILFAEQQKHSGQKGIIEKLVSSFNIDKLIHIAIQKVMKLEQFQIMNKQGQSQKMKQVMQKLKQEKLRLKLQLDLVYEQVERKKNQIESQTANKQIITGKMREFDDLKARYLEKEKFYNEFMADYIKLTTSTQYLISTIKEFYSQSSHDSITPLLHSLILQILTKLRQQHRSQINSNYFSHYMSERLVNCLITITFKSINQLFDQNSRCLQLLRLVQSKVILGMDSQKDHKTQDQI